MSNTYDVRQYITSISKLAETATLSKDQVISICNNILDAIEDTSVEITNNIEATNDRLEELEHTVDGIDTDSIDEKLYDFEQDLKDYENRIDDLEGSSFISEDEAQDLVSNAINDVEIVIGDLKDDYKTDIDELKDVVGTELGDIQFKLAECQKHIFELEVKLDSRWYHRFTRRKK